MCCANRNHEALANADSNDAVRKDLDQKPRLILNAYFNWLDHLQTHEGLFGYL
jgi:hypothetical protein